MARAPRVGGRPFAVEAGGEVVDVDPDAGCHGGCVGGGGGEGAGLGAEEGGGAAERRGGRRRGGEEEGEGDGEPEQEEEPRGVLPQLVGESGGCWASPRPGISHGRCARVDGDHTEAPLSYAFVWLCGIMLFFSELAGSAAVLCV